MSAQLPNLALLDQGTASPRVAPVRVLARYARCGPVLAHHWLPCLSARQSRCAKGVAFVADLRAEQLRPVILRDVVLWAVAVDGTLCMGERGVTAKGGGQSLGDPLWRPP